MAQRKTTKTTSIRRGAKSVKPGLPRSPRKVRAAKMPVVAALPLAVAAPTAAPATQPYVSSLPARRHISFMRVVTWPLRSLWYHKWWLVNLAVVAIAILAILSESIRQSTVDLRFDGNTVQMQNVPLRDTAIVFGAGVLQDRTPTDYLKNRIETAVDLYKADRVDSLLMSGDNSASHYNEPDVMKAYAVKLGVKAEDVVTDYAGFNTYDTCFRAKAVFGIRSATLVTQGYHLPRAIYTCQDQGIDTIGVAAKHAGRDWTVSYLAREHIATAKAMVQKQFDPQPTVLGKTETTILQN